MVLLKENGNDGVAFIEFNLLIGDNFELREREQFLGHFTLFNCSSVIINSNDIYSLRCTVSEVYKTYKVVDMIGISI